jgi:preprotein translocase SecE subunit
MARATLPAPSNQPSTNGTLAAADPVRVEHGLGIYKYGRGFWVRTLTAIALGMLFLSAAGWTWNQLSLLAMPAKAWDLTLTQTPANAAAGTPVTLRVMGDRGPEVVGTSTVQSFTQEGRGSGTLRIAPVAAEKGRYPGEARSIILGPADTGTVAEVAAVTRIESFPRVYVQGAAALAVCLIGGFIIYRFVGNKPSSVEFLIATDEEMRKVNWSTRKIIVESTYVVIGATVLIAAYIFVLDFILQLAVFRPIVSS